VAYLGKDNAAPIAGMSIWDETGFTLGDPLVDHLTWHCMGTFNVLAGKSAVNDHCIVTDPDGDQIMSDIWSDPQPFPSKTGTGKGTFTGGTSKFTGITGSISYVTHSGEYKLTADNTYVQPGDNEGSYKLP
jgi:hypothetical protein